MIEIVFSDSACGALKVAQSFGKGKYRPSCIGICISHSDGSEVTQAEIEEEKRKFLEEEQMKWETAIPIGGNSADVFCFHLGLSYGSIQNPLCIPDRLSALKIMMGCWSDDLEGELKELLRQAQTNLAIIKKRMESEEDVRIWFSNNPDELCGFYWFLDYLQSLSVIHSTVFSVKLPYFNECGNTIIRYRSWGDVDPGEFHDFLNFSKPISDHQIRYFSSEWKKLQEENSVLRATVNGRLSSVPENIYDHYIEWEIANQSDTFKEAVVVGNLLGKHDLSTSDGFLHERIDKLVKEGKLIAVTSPEQGDPGYWRILKKA